MASATAVPRLFSATWAGVIRGYHMHQTLWTPYVREKPTMVREPGNEHDRSAQVECGNAIKICDEAHFYLELPTSHKYLLHYAIGSGTSFRSLL